MTNPTSNFGWQMPTSTDLVTDLPADFETFGQAVDTSLADLKGGTSGQVLSKASNTDMDFTWVAQDDSNAIQNTIVDAKGDLIAASAADTPARLAVGNNGETLVADSSTSTGLRYQGSMAAGRNFVINGGFDIWQRGTSFNTGSINFPADRWQSARSGQVTGMTVSRQATNDTTNLPFIQYCARMQRNSGVTTTDAIYINTIFETVNSIPLAGKTVTLSFYARAGANYSAANGYLISRLISGTGTDQNNFSSSFTGQATPIAVGTNVLTTTWQRFQASATLSGSITQLAVQFQSDPSGTAGANDYFEVTGVQVEVGAVATQFSRAGGTIQGELAACQRYYEKSYVISTAPGATTADGASYSFTNNAAQTTGMIGYEARWKVTKRSAPTLTIYDTFGVSGKCTRTLLGVADSSNQAVATANVSEVSAIVYSSGTYNAGGIVFNWVANSEL